MAKGNGSLALATREALLGVKLKTERVTIEEWGMDVIVRELPPDAFIDWQEAHEETEKKGLSMARLGAISIVNDEGAIVLSEDDVPEFATKGMAGLQAIMTACLKVNGLGGDDSEDLEKN